MYSEIQIENDGEPISKEEAGKIFTRYYRGETSVIDSVGIGLSLADSIVRRDNGYIIAESYEKQKRFITDAGHEIKTPLTVIAANVDLLEADIGENECLSDIREETARLSSLTGDLVSLSRMEEAEGAILKTDFPVSDLITEEANTFRAPITAQKKNFSVQVSPNLTMNGSPGAIRQLISILLDNALKYSPEGGGIALSLTASKKELLLTVSNTTKEVMREEELPRLFDRFYRADESRSRATGGSGIGLSMAQMLVSRQKGKLSVEYFPEEIIRFTAEL